MVLSVIIPVYNAQAYIGRLLNCLEKQLNEQIELIFVDDGSVDDGYKILTEYSCKYSEIKVYQQENSGAASARQLGLKNAQGQFVTFLDCDDVICDGYFGYLLDMLRQKQKYDMYVLSYYTFFSEKNIMPRINKAAVYSCGEDYVRAVFNEEIIGESALWNHIYSRTFLSENNIGFDLESKIAEDCLFNDDCMTVVSSVYVSDFAGYTWMCDHESLTGRCPENMGDTLRKHIYNLGALQKKYFANDKDTAKYILKVKASFFKYLLNNIQRSRLVNDEKARRIKDALKNNIDELTVRTQYKGIQRAFLMLAYKQESVLWYKISYWCSVSAIKNTVISKAVKVVNKIRGI